MKLKVAGEVNINPPLRGRVIIFNNGFFFGDGTEDEALQAIDRDIKYQQELRAEALFSIKHLEYLRTLITESKGE